MIGDSLANLIERFSRRGRALLHRHLPPHNAANGPVDHVEQLEVLARALQSSRGEASGVAVATDLVALYDKASVEERSGFFHRLAIHFDPDPVKLDDAWHSYQAVGTSALPMLAAAVEAPRQELFRRINLAPNGTAALVRMRADLLRFLSLDTGELTRVDADLAHLLQSWFNRGFLTMRTIDWSSPANMLERVIRYEAVHDISDWDDLRRRLDPPDRRCYGFFHPSLPDEPLIFVEVALTSTISNSIQAILDTDRVPIPAKEATTAIFYSISNCQRGLRGVSFGHFLIKQVAEDLRSDLPNLSCFATLSPLPGFRAYLRQEAPELDKVITRDLPGALNDTVADQRLQVLVLPQLIRYFREARTPSGEPLDPVARFHLGNGARLERINWAADQSTNGLRQSAGIMVNYLYELDRIEENHEAYAHRGLVVTGSPFDQLAAQFSLVET